MSAICSVKKQSAIAPTTSRLFVRSCLTKNFYAVQRFFGSMIPSNAAPPTAIIDQGDGSGTDATASPVGLATVMKLALIAAPLVASYSLVARIVPKSKKIANTRSSDENGAINNTS